MSDRNMSVLPTQSMLRNTGASSLASAIDLHGGLAVFSGRLKINLNKRRPNGYWSDFDTLSSSLKEFMDQKIKDGQDPVMPTAQELVNAGHADLVKAIRLHGGFSVVAAKMGLHSHRKQMWNETNVLKVLQRMQKQGMQINRQVIRDENVNGLESAVDRFGGFPYFTALLEDNNEACILQLPFSDGVIDQIDVKRVPNHDQLQYNRDCPVPYIERVATCMETWLAERPSLGRLPTKVELESTGRGNIWKAIQRAGGIQKLSQYMEIPYKETRGKKKRTQPLPQHEPHVMDEINLWDAYHEFLLID